MITTRHNHREVFFIIFGKYLVAVWGGHPRCPGPGHRDSRDWLHSEPQLRVLIQEELVSGRQIRDSLLQLLELGPQLKVLLLDEMMSLINN